MTQRVIDQRACHCPLHCAGDAGLVSAAGESRVITTLSVVETFKICDTATATRSLPVPPAVFPLRLPVQMMRMSPLSPKQRRHSHLWRQPRTVGNLLVSREIASFTNGRIPCNNSRLRGKWPGVFFTRMSKLTNYRYLVINTCTGLKVRPAAQNDSPVRSRCGESMKSRFRSRSQGSPLP